MTGQSSSVSGASGATMSGLEQAVKAVELLVQQKLMHPSRDELGLVLFGTRGTLSLHTAAAAAAAFTCRCWLVG
jgi:hypothetical protein